MGIQVEETDHSLCLSWDYRKLPKKRFVGCVLVLFWLIWTPMTLFVTAAAFQVRGIELAFVLVWLVFGWVGVILIPYVLLMRRWRESIAIDMSSITLTYSGLLARRSRTFPLSSIEKIAIGHVEHVDGGESIQTLNVHIVPKGWFWEQRHMVAYWLSDELQDQVFQAIEAFVDLHGLNVPMTRLD